MSVHAGVQEREVMDEKLLYTVLRQQQWQMSKGHLWAMLESFAYDPRFREIHKIVETFVAEIEGRLP